MRKNSAEPFRDIDFKGATRGAVVHAPPGKTKISIRIDTAILDHFRRQAELAGGGSYQSMINDALMAFIHQSSILGAARRAIREEFARVEKSDSFGEQREGVSALDESRQVRNAGTVARMKKTRKPPAQRARNSD